MGLYTALIFFLAASYVFCGDAPDATSDNLLDASPSLFSFNATSEDDDSNSTSIFSGSAAVALGILTTACDGDSEPGTELVSCVTSQVFQNPQIMSLIFSVQNSIFGADQDESDNSTSGSGAVVGTNSSDYKALLESFSGKKVKTYEEEVAQAVMYTPAFCEISQSFLGCVDPYARRCLGSNNSFVSAIKEQILERVTANSTEIAPTGNETITIFGFPVIMDPVGWISFSRTQMSALCENDGAPLKAVMTNVGCFQMTMFKLMDSCLDFFALPKDLVEQLRPYVKNLTHILDDCPSLFDMKRVSTIDLSSLNSTIIQQECPALVHLQEEMAANINITEMAANFTSTPRLPCSNMAAAAMCVSQTFDAQCHDPYLVAAVKSFWNAYFDVIGCHKI